MRKALAPVTNTQIKRGSSLASVSTIALGRAQRNREREGEGDGEGDVDN